ncbi:glycosyltransferase [Bacillus sp. KH172YL63]|uniref:glycosyltransferase n=1 Tax=Bacillus sp. KH172YL63 TaxID=2709784 RepID=UPI0013E4C217|nr:glycosyltransferase [Bacillus sp. KH172YL63]BCB05754.1 glycosyl transferase family 1 [Bacillus sp. KH172YL63]
MSTRKVVIFRDKLLPASETFVKAQAEGLSDFTPYYVGYQRIKNSLALSEERTYTIHNIGTRLHNKYSEKWLKKWLINTMIYKEIKRIDPKLIHAHFGPDGTLALPIAQKLNIPLIVTFHGYDVTRSIDHLKSDNAYNIKHYVRHMDALQESDAVFIAASDFIKRKLVEKGFSNDQIITHYIGVDLETLKVDHSITREDSVLFVGRLVKNKGCEYLIQAMKMVNDKYPNTRLIIAGDGPERQRLEQLAGDLNINASFLGAISHKDVVLEMNKAKVFSVPSIEIESGASEGFGMVFAEAQAMALPAVSFDTGGIPEAISHNETGFIVPQKDHKQLADSIIKLLSDVSLWDKFSSNAVEHVNECFNLKKQNNKLEEIYNSILS